MPVLTADDLAGMAATLEESLPDECLIVAGSVNSGAQVPDGSGGWIPADAEDLPPDVVVACRVSPATGGGRDFEDVDASRIASSVPWTITFPRRTSIDAAAHVIANERIYEVAAPLDPRSFSVGTRVIARLVL